MTSRIGRAMRTLVPVACLAATVASATHSVDTRFTVLGFVRDHDGRPMSDRRVEVVRERTGFAFRGRTDGGGFYVVVAWVRDEDRGDRLRVQVNGTSLRVSATFDPSDRRSERGTRVDFTGARAVEVAEAFETTLRSFLGR